MCAELTKVNACQKEDEDYIDQHTRDGPVELRVYGHQIAGHSLLLKLGKAVCKPVIPRERFFYATSIPQDLKDFTPIYHGVVSVRYQQSDDGRIHFFAIPRPIGNGSIRDRNVSDGEGFETWAYEYLYKLTRWLSKSPHEEIVQMSSSMFFRNPWSQVFMTNMQSILSQYSTNQLQNMFQDYLVLEDLTCQYECPCILDLKMGTRVYGDDQSKDQKRKKVEKCSTSTCGRLGVWISGMQVYNAAKQVYIFKNKYYGRQLTIEGFNKELCFFLHNGFKVRNDIIPTLLDQLCELKERVAKQDSYRFFCSSLLIMYDGRTGQPTLGLSTDETKSCKKRPFVSEEEELSPHCLSGGNMTVTDCKTRERRERAVDDQRKATLSTSSSESLQTLEECRRIVDVRMIDFAHVTHKNGDILYNGPDEGYILGLDTLISAFQAIGRKT